MRAAERSASSTMAAHVTRIDPVHRQPGLGEHRRYQPCGKYLATGEDSVLGPGRYFPQYPHRSESETEVFEHTVQFQIKMMPDPGGQGATGNCPAVSPFDLRQQRIEFVLDEKLTVKRLRFSDIVQEQASDTEAEDAAAQFDVDFSIMALELSGFIKALTEAFGGAEESESTTAANTE